MNCVREVQTSSVVLSVSLNIRMPCSSMMTSVSSVMRCAFVSGSFSSWSAVGVACCVDGREPSSTCSASCDIEGDNSGAALGVAFRETSGGTVSSGGAAAVAGRGPGTAGTVGFCDVGMERLELRSELDR